jgi:hypothetical protein
MTLTAYDTKERPLTIPDKCDTIWTKIKEKAEELRYGSLACELTIDNGIIKQANITKEVERIRAD